MDRIVSARVRAQRWYVRYPRAVPLAIFLAVLTIALLGVYGMERIGAERTRSQARVVSADVGAALESRALARVTYLRAGALLLSASPRIDAQAFRELAASVVEDDGEPGNPGISWAPRVKSRDLAGFQAARRAEGLSGYTVHPKLDQARDFAVPVTYTGRAATDDTAGGPNPALGFDMASEPRRRAAMALAARDGRPIATGKVELVKRTGADRSGFLIYLPVYARLASAPGQAPASGPLRGFICAPVNAQVFLDAALAVAPVPGLDVALYDSSISPDHLLARAGGIPNRERSYTRTLRVGGRSLMLVVAGRPTAALSNLSLVTLLLALLVAALLTLLVHIVTRNAQEDLTALDWLEEQVSIRNTLTRELNHRVKNTLANVLSIIALTRRRAAGLEDFADSLTGRIMALSATHDLLTGLSWKSAPLRAVIAAELAPYTDAGDQIVTLSGPEVALAPNDALSLGLAIHELATNASKYGALSVLAGQVSVRWEMQTADTLRLVWQEQGGPMVAAQRRRGFGTDLIEKIVAHELGHGVDLRFEPSGVCCTLVVPVRVAVAFQMRAVARQKIRRQNGSLSRSPSLE